MYSSVKIIGGIYLLIIECVQDTRVRVGSLGEIQFLKGYYIYVGSAQNNLLKRILRHLKKIKKVRWHIDYILQNRNFKVVKVILLPGLGKEFESLIAQKFSTYLNYIPKFGCSDDKVSKSHLFYTPHINDFNQVLSRVIRELSIKDKTKICVLDILEETISNIERAFYECLS